MISPDPLFLPDVTTVLTEQTAMVSLRDGYLRCFGSHPAARCLAIYFAQAVLETGHFKSMHCFNYGNVKRSKSWEGSWTWYGCDERSTDPKTIKAWIKSGGRAEGATAVWFDPPHPQTHFRAFKDAAEGGADQIGFFLGDRYRPCHARAFAGDAAGFGHALHVAGYYTADEATYTRALVSLANAAEGPAQASLVGGDLTDLGALRALCWGTAIESLRGSPARAQVVA